MTPLGRTWTPGWLFGLRLLSGAFGTSKGSEMTARRRFQNGAYAPPCLERLRPDQLLTLGDCLRARHAFISDQTGFDRVAVMILSRSRPGWSDRCRYRAQHL